MVDPKSQMKTTMETTLESSGDYRSIMELPTTDGLAFLMLLISSFFMRLPPGWRVKLAGWVGLTSSIPLAASLSTVLGLRDLYPSWIWVRNEQDKARGSEDRNDQVTQYCDVYPGVGFA